MGTQVDLLIKFLDSFEEGRIFLSHGMYAYKFLTKNPPLSVAIAEIQGGNIPVCHGSVNMFGVSLVEDGFVLVADVQSESTELTWQATLGA